MPPPQLHLVPDPFCLAPPPSPSNAVPSSLPFSSRAPPPSPQSVNPPAARGQRGTSPKSRVGEREIVGSRDRDRWCILFCEAGT